jgi:putative hydrolase of the HAD superfamily
MKSKRITNSGFKKYFDAVVIAGEDTKEVKPHKEAFIKIVNLLGVPPEKCIFIGDNPKVDVLGAKEIGMKTIILEDNQSLFGESPIYPDFSIKGKILTVLRN